MARANKKNLPFRSYVTAKWWRVALFTAPIYLVLLGLPFWWRYHLIFFGSSLNQDSVAAFSVPAETQAEDNFEYLSGKPKHISLPGLGIALPVVGGDYDPASQTWDLSWDKVQFATTTTVPNNQEGGTFLYGHNTKNVLAKTIGIKKNQKLQIKTGNDLIFTYRFTHEEHVAPTDDSVLAHAGEPRLALMTCGGVWNEYRRVMYFKFESVEKL